MDSINSFKGYGKVNEMEEKAYRKKSRKRYTIIGLSAIFLIVIVVGAVFGPKLLKKKNNSSPNSPTRVPVDSIKVVCSVTQYKDSCFSSLSSMKSSNTADPEELFKLSLQVAMDELSKFSSFPAIFAGKVNNDTVKAALNVCQDLFLNAIDQFNTSISSMQPINGDKLLSLPKIDDLKTWLSAAVTDQETCLDGIGDVSTELRVELSSAMKNSTEFASNSLAIATKILTILQQFDIPIHRKLLSHEFPIWVSKKDRRLLQEETPIANATVAKNGTGTFRTIQDAVDSVPKKSKERFVIYVKEGEYVEKVVVDKAHWNVMLVGDGQNKTIISGSLNFIDGTPTFATATFTAVGRNFMARDIGFRNTAGPEKHQAVAVRSGSDHSVFYRCTFDAYQDTLYTHSLRQFYRDCTITGTIDFIFGNAAVVFQGCIIQPRQPLKNQQNTITAQGKTDPNQNTGISIQRCQITQPANLTAKTYLGRPWKPYSTTVVMQSTIGGFIHPAGWLSWDGVTTPPKTIFYGEYRNTGPGSNVTKRVDWAGYKPAISDNQAGKFTVDSFIQGTEWLPETGVIFGASL
ncbi:pectinesterase 3-like [Tasmannia lanceolata]|uniref:pectinesterase 3-like n=1 Tax=Tasmannia lanceolata TaxID=3420 RepID=UPI004064147C